MNNIDFQYILDPITNEISSDIVKMISPEIRFVPVNSDTRFSKLYQEWLNNGNTPKSTDWQG